MAEYRIRETGQIVTDLRRAFPNASLPAVMTVEALESLGVDPILPTPLPETTQFQSVMRDGIEEIDGKWHAKYSVYDWEPEAIQSAIEDQWVVVRKTRDELLSKCDWTHTTDSALSDEDKYAWAYYRQALRDITLQPDPFAIEWPYNPNGESYKPNRAR